MYALFLSDTLAGWEIRLDTVDVTEDGAWVRLNLLNDRGAGCSGRKIPVSDFVLGTIHVTQVSGRP